MRKDKTYSLCETVADIAYIAGERNYYCADSRKKVADFITWAKEFEKMYEKIQWGINSEVEYIDAIYLFADYKIKLHQS
ncbi:hypothetical protein [Ferruginibacter albus]|uniref:hypothetical protein n=1 Tax=Ferruginibacter albus TaxID=2875540 RepID=UPI001CC36EA1|nr:hypothetical protein [Ferruginibacter albus]UAY52531.1 hypothetical protein K9M53_02295 [Ferruginibacter albus]